MKIIVPSMKFVPIPQWDFRVFHNETKRDIEINITHDDLKRDHIIIRDPEQPEEAPKKVEGKAE
jgi:hypothetical protein